jgi:hypothetical protein
VPLTQWYINGTALISDTPRELQSRNDIKTENIIWENKFSAIFHRVFLNIT